jgi:hypothetical protein
MALSSARRHALATIAAYRGEGLSGEAEGYGPKHAGEAGSATNLNERAQPEDGKLDE